MKPLILFLLIMSSISFTQNANSQLKPEDLNQIVSEARKKFNIPAIAVTTMNADVVLTSTIQGVRTLNTSDNVTINDLFHIGSCSKSVLSFIAGKLVDDGKIQWKTPFFELFPELKESSKTEYLPITLEDLLLCKAGIAPYTSGADPFPDVNSDRAKYDFTRYLLQQTPVAKVHNGSFDFVYSSASYSIAALMLEKVSQLTYEDLISKYIISELNINTYIGFSNTFNPMQPWGHMINKGAIDVFPPDHPYRLNKLIVPAGDLSMTPLGFAKFVQLNMQGLRGKGNFLTVNTYKHIHYAYPGFSLGVGNGKMAGYKYSGMDGSAGTFFCRAILIPDADFAFTIMTNAGSGNGRMKAVDWITTKMIKKQFNWWWKF